MERAKRVRKSRDNHAVENTPNVEARYRALFESVPDAILVADENGRYLEANQAASSLLGYSIEQLTRMGVADVVVAGAQWAHEEYARFRDDGRWRGELDLRRNDGTLVTVDAHATSVTVPSGTVYVSVLRDISERREFDRERDQIVRQLNSDRQWLRTVIDRSPVGIMLVEGSEDERVLINRQAEILFGATFPHDCRLDEIRHQKVLLRPDGTSMTFDELAVVRALRGETIQAEEKLIHQPSGSDLCVLASAGPIRDPNGKIVGAVAIYDDITPIKELERQREEWTSVIAHDLRQPITVIVAYSGLIRRRLDQGQGATGVDQLLNHLSTAARSLNRMIEDLLDVSRMEARRLVLHPQTVDLNLLVRSLRERLAQVTAGHSVELQIHDPIPLVIADPDRVEQVVGNLVTNATKYGYPDSLIVIDCRERDGMVQVSVTNRGEGIPPEETSKVFKRFHRSPQAIDQKASGLGLGLYIAKGLVEAQGGQIWVDSTPRETTTFSFTLPPAGPNAVGGEGSLQKA